LLNCVELSGTGTASFPATVWASSNDDNLPASR
jgi:hypothetical protein